MLKISPTKNTPEVVLKPDGIIRIKGRSMKANLTDFSKQIEDWIDIYISNPADLTCVDFHLEYLNTNNLTFYISMLKKIESTKLMNKKCIINWYYEEGDDDIIEKGEYISSTLDVSFNFIMISNHNDI